MIAAENLRLIAVVVASVAAWFALTATGDAYVDHVSERQAEERRAECVALATRLDIPTEQCR